MYDVLHYNGQSLGELSLSEVSYLHKISSLQVSNAAAVPSGLRLHNPLAQARVGEGWW